LPAENGQPENIATVVTDVSERVSTLVREEIELAQAEVTAKLRTIARGAIAVAAGAIFGVFGLVVLLEALAWGLNTALVSGTGDLWIGFAIVTGVLFVFAVAAFLFAWRKLRVGAPTPDMAIDEAKRIRETVASGAEGERESVTSGGEGATTVATREGGR
jgi:protein-S-isoprenylcysteine O-methyltransferase Ste14